MTTGLTVSITEELVAELEALAGECGQQGTNWYEPRHMAAFPEYACDQDFVVAASPSTILALLAERAELLRDAERYRWLLDSADSMHWENMLHFSDFESKEEIGQFIDAAMQQDATP